MEELKRLAINEEGFAFDPETGNSFVLNQTGLFIVKKLREGLSEEKIINEILKEFEVEEETARRDFYDFMEQLRILGLIDNK
ncbi:MAG TPA: PqqD family protein [Aquifex aeolicus]|uniref:PqqD family protein n=1 Tax=Aquifex aeolicus TaxID=63363 RepID=A0A9D0YP33_AQUAO|nr:PqqD family protein [Aquificales bacterium]HIP98127.1 PqqD family protein [Aquifex aeolicus]HIQ26648.1 PqqD family protein [Aquifex aeolicus]